RPGGPAPRRGWSFFERQPELMHGVPDGRDRALNTQPFTQLGERGVGLRADQLGQPGAVNLDGVLADTRTRRQLAVIAATLLDASRPGGADAEHLGDLLGLL